MRGRLDYKLRRGGRGKPVVTGWTGADQSADGSYAQVEQQVDRENKTYRKKVVSATGKTLKDYDGPLDQGPGHPRTWSRRTWFGQWLRRHLS